MGYMVEENNPIEALSEAFAKKDEQIAHLEESIADVRLMMQAEDRGWSIITGFHTGERLEGLELDEVHQVAQMISPRVAAGSLPGRAVSLHSGFVWGPGLQIDGCESPKKGTRGQAPAIYRFFTDPTNQESVFGPAAQITLQTGRFVEGNVLAACNTKDKKVNLVPFNQVTDVRVDPDFPENVLAYQRTWNPKTGPDSQPIKRWYITRRWEGVRPKSITTGNERVPVDQDVTVVDLRVNRQPGFVLGIPDGLAGIHWAEAYGQHVQYGQVVTEALSKLLFKLTSKSKGAAQNAAAKVAGMTGVGNTASMVEGQDVEAIRTAGNAYAFEKLRPIAAMAASAWNVSNADLLNDSAAAGASYGALNGLVLGNRNAMVLMRGEWGQWLQDIFEVNGFGRPAIHWEPIEAPDPYRASQSLTLLSPTLTDEEYRRKSLDILDLPGDPSEIPPTLKLRSQPASAAAQQASPDQGRANQTGGADSGAKNDLRTDMVSEALRMMQLDEMRQLVERFEGVADRLAGN